MSHLPILGELFISHRIEFLLIGLVLALIIGMNNSEKALYWIAASSTVYIISELLSNVPTDYLIEMILLLVGTMALGGIMGFLMVVIILRIRER